MQDIIANLDIELQHTTCINIRVQTFLTAQFDGYAWSTRFRKDFLQIMFHDMEHRVYSRTHGATRLAKMGEWNSLR